MAKLRGSTWVPEGSSTGVRGSWSNGVAERWNIGLAHRSGDGRICEPDVISGAIIKSRSIGSRAFAGSAYILVWPNRKTYTELASRRYHKPLELLMPSLLLSG